MNQILTDRVWPELKKLKKRSKYFKAAIGYASSSTALNVKKNDILVCDASLSAIRCGQTSAKLIQKIISKGGKVFNLPGLHAKMYVFDDATFIGSANLSDHSSKGGLIEAGFLTRDVSVCADAGRTVMSLAAEGEEINKAYLKKILKVKVVRTPTRFGVARRSRRAKGSPDHWLLGVYERTDTNDEPAYEKGYKELGVSPSSNQVTDIEYPTSVVKKKGFKIDDIVTEISRKKSSDKSPSCVFFPRRILHIEHGEGSTYLYLQKHAEEISWTRFLKIIKENKIQEKVSKNSNRGAKEIGILMLDLANRKLKA